MAERVRYRSGWTCSCVARSFPVIEEYMRWEGLIESTIDVFQWGWSTGVAASANTHARGGPIDVAQRSPAHIRVWRMFGWDMQERINVGTGPHAHGGPYRCPHKSPAAQQQERDWDRKDAGLVGGGQVQGPWPIDPWDVALRRMEAEMAKTLEQMKDELKRELLAEIRPLLGDLPGRVWGADVIPNVFTGNPKNPTVAARTALVEIQKEIVAARKDIKQPPAVS